MSEPDAGPVVTLTWEPLSGEPIWHGPAAAARGRLGEGTYFSPNRIVGVTGEGVLVTEEDTGQSTYFLTAADVLAQHLADISYQVLTAIPDAAQWTAPTFRESMPVNKQLVGVCTIDGADQIIELGVAGTASLQAIQAGQATRPVDLSSPVDVDAALRAHVAFMVEVGVVSSGAATTHAGYNRMAAAGRVLERISNDFVDHDQAVLAPYSHSYRTQNSDAVQRLADDIRQDRYWTAKFVEIFAGELEAMNYPGEVARTAAHEHAGALAWAYKAHAVIHTVTAPANPHLLVDLANRARQLRGGQEPIPGTIARWARAASKTPASQTSHNREQVEMHRVPQHFNDPDIIDAALVHNSTFGPGTSTGPARLTVTPPHSRSSLQPQLRPAGAVNGRPYD